MKIRVKTLHGNNDDKKDGRRKTYAKEKDAKGSFKEYTPLLSRTNHRKYSK